jgi:hypothetical protein
MKKLNNGLFSRIPSEGMQDSAEAKVASGAALISAIDRIAKIAVRKVERNIAFHTGRLFSSGELSEMEIEARDGIFDAVSREKLPIERLLALNMLETPAFRRIFGAACQAAQKWTRRMAHRADVETLDGFSASACPVEEMPGYEGALSDALHFLALAGEFSPQREAKSLSQKWTRRLLDEAEGKDLPALSVRDMKAYRALMGAGFRALGFSESQAEAKLPRLLVRKSRTGKSGKRKSFRAWSK